MTKDNHFDRKQAKENAKKARLNERDKLESKTHKWVRTQHGKKLVKIIG